MASLAVFAVAAFAAGVLTFLAPCTLPILPAYLAYSTKSKEKKITSNTLFFALGLSLVFLLMGVFAGTLGRFIISYKREVVYAFAGAVILFGLMSILGKNLKIFKQPKLKRHEGPLGSLLFGGVFALTWTGCIGPVLGFVLILAANTQTALSGGLLLFLYGLGLVFPLILLSFGIDKLPKDGRVWRLLRGKLFEFKFRNKVHYVHSTNLISGALFILLGVFLILEANFKVTSIFPYSMTEWVFGIEDKLVEIFKLKT